jgi:hypothetical protein
MMEYRAYTVGRDRQFMGFESMVCANDAEAIAKATNLLHDHAIELWNGLRLVIRLDNDPKRT